MGSRSGRTHRDSPLQLRAARRDRKSEATGHVRKRLARPKHRPNTRTIASSFRKPRAGRPLRRHRRRPACRLPVPRVRERPPRSAYVGGQDARPRVSCAFGEKRVPPRACGRPLSRSLTETIALPSRRRNPSRPAGPRLSYRPGASTKNMPRSAPPFGSRGAIEVILTKSRFSERAFVRRTRFNPLSQRDRTGGIHCR